MIHATTEQMKQFREANPNARPGSVHAAATTNDLFYHGGTGGIGVETAPKIYLVLWGSQWNNNDPSGEAAILQNFYRGVGGSSWLNSVTQYCQGVATRHRHLWQPPARMPATRLAFLPQSGRTTQALRRRSHASPSLPPKPSAPHSTSATPPLPATPPSSM